MPVADLPPMQAEIRPAGAPAARPNIIYILTDDHSLQTIGAYGWRLSAFCREHDVTPNIDRLAREGAIFRRSFCENSICSPSRATILTGAYSHEHGVDRLSQPMNEGIWTLPEALQAAGYRTQIIGKWHIGSAPRGFDDYAVLDDQGEYWDPRFLTPKGEEKSAGYATDVITERTLAWLREHGREQPFLLHMHHKAPHRPFVPPPRLYHWLEDVAIPEPETLFDDYATRASPASSQAMEIARHMRLDYDLKVVPRGKLTYDLVERELPAFEEAFGDMNEAFLANPPTGEALTRWKYQRYMKDYLRCVKAVDESVGRLLDTLDELGLAKNTIVVYSSDQGFFNGEHGWFDKRWIYEESLGMPLVMRWPALIKPGTSVQPMVQNTDHAPTLAEAAGVPVPASVRGRSLWPLLRGETPADWRSSVYYRYIDEGHKVARHDGVRTATHTLACFAETGEWELYELASDPHQVRNRVDDPELATVREQLRRELAAYRENLKVPVFPPGPDKR